VEVGIEPTCPDQGTAVSQTARDGYHLPHLHRELIFSAILRSTINELGATRWDVERELSSFPPKVILAKIRKMIKQGKLSGCACGCRGDFKIPGRLSI
jgi:hypothetical protein